MMTTTTDSQVLKRLDFPAYCVKVLDNGLVAIAGGGGTSKTGVGNCIELGIVDYANDELLLNNKTGIKALKLNNKAYFHSIHTFEPNDAVMKFISFTSERSSISNGRNGYSKYSKQNGNLKTNHEYDAVKSDLYIAAAVNNSVEIYKCQPTVNKSNTTNTLKKPSDSHLKQRTNSKTKISAKNSAPMANMTSSKNGLIASAFLKLMNVIELKHNSEQDENLDDIFEMGETAKNPRRISTSSSSSRRQSASTFNFREDESIDTLAVSKTSKDRILLCVGTSKGNIVVWHLNSDVAKSNDSNNNNKTVERFKFKKLHVFNEVHGKHEIDELQTNSAIFYSKDGSGESVEHHSLLSIGKDNRCFIWSMTSLDKHTEIVYLPKLGNNTNLRMKHARFANSGKTLFTTYIPRVRGGGKDLSSYIQRWQLSVSSDKKQLDFDVACTCRIRNTILTSIQASKDGNLVCVGDYEGRIYLYDLNFNRLSFFKKQHSSVVTDLAFYHDSFFLQSAPSEFKNNNKLILSLSIDRTLQCYTYLDTKNISRKLAIRAADAASRFSMVQLFKILFIFLGFLFLFCYFFTNFE